MRRLHLKFKLSRLLQKNIFSISEKRQSFQLDLDSLTPPPLSFSAPELSSRCVMPFKALRNAVSSSQLLHELAMARVHKAVAMKEEQTKNKDRPPNHNTDIPYNSSLDRENVKNNNNITEPMEDTTETKKKHPDIIIKSDSIEDTEYKYNPHQVSMDSEASEHKWQHMSFDEDYTASTVSTDEEYTDDGSLDADLDRRSQYSNEEETYNPRDKMARPSPLKEFIEEEEEPSESEPLKPLPLPDPNFVPKPILKRREADIVETKPVTEPTPPKIEEKPKTTDYLKIEKPKIFEKSKTAPKTKSSEKSEKSKAVEKAKKEDKITLFKKITKLPGQKSFQFPKLLNKKGLEKSEEDLPNEKTKVNNKIDKIQDKVSEEGRTVIDYYGNIVKEYGRPKKAPAPMYLKTEDLKEAAEQQQLEEKKPESNDENKATNQVQAQAGKPKKTVTKPNNTKAAPVKGKPANSVNKAVKPKSPPAGDKNQLEKKVKTEPPKPVDIQNNTPKKGTQQIVLRKAERATIVIPINYQELEEKAKINVRSAIDYTVDVCLLILAFWVYFFKDERLAIPFLTLIIYRQLQETLLLNIPEWYKRYTPNWLKKKTS